MSANPRPAFTIARKSLLVGGVGCAVIVAGGAVAYELVEDRILPGRLRLAEFLGECNVPTPKLTYDPAGPTVSGVFYSRYRNREVGYAIGYPPQHGPGDRLPLMVWLHGFGGDHVNSGLGRKPSKTLAMRIANRPLKPMAVVTVDGGTGYWTPHPGDDPFHMVLDELTPMCRRRGLGDTFDGLAIAGLSMGGYGALPFAEKRPDLFRAVAAISPAIWTSYSQANAANPIAYASAAAFAANDVVTHTAGLASMPVRIAGGVNDPFEPGVAAIKSKLTPKATVIIGPGCHGGPFMTQQLPPSLAFLGRHLGRGA